MRANVLLIGKKCNIYSYFVSFFVNRICSLQSVGHGYYVMSMVSLYSVDIQFQN